MSPAERPCTALAAGIPAAWIWRYPPPHPYYHSAGDTPRWVDFTCLAEDATASAFTAFRLAAGPDIAPSTDQAIGLPPGQPR